MNSLREFLKSEYNKGKVIYPNSSEYFSAFNETPFDKVKVVIIGQDPYHGPNQAHGLCFSVKRGIKPPPSLVNIYKELQDDLGITPPNHGCLTDWAKQGVFLLNSILTVEQSKPASHHDKGWEQFTDRVIALLNEKRNNLVFVLWGAYAQKKAAFLDRKKHLVLESPHPSPFSVYKGFYGSRPFSKINAYLKSKGIKGIDWQIRED